MLLFYLEDPVTGETRNMAAPDGTTEQDVRRAYGGKWLDARRTVCPAPYRIQGPARWRAPQDKPILAKVA